MQKGMESDNCCVHCGAVGESRENVLVHCSYDQSCWEELGIQTRMTSNVSFPQSFFSYFRLLDENLLLKIAVTIWAIWNRRNEQVRNNYSFSSYRAVQAGLNFLSSWSASRFTPPHIAIHPSLPKWEKPPPGFIKCNIDAAVDNNQEAMGAVFVLHDEEGALIMRGCWHANDVFPKVSRGISVERVFFHHHHYIYILVSVSPLNINQI
jgi:hypothetical protein